MDGVYIRIEGSMTVGLNSLNTSFFYGSSNQALWNIYTVVSPSAIDTEWETSQEFLPPPTQLRNGPDKNDSNNGNEHVGMQKRC